LKLNKCKLTKIINLNKIELPINKWILNEFIETQNQSTKHIENFRFDEASRVIYKFVWHYYCDWYLEFLKPIFISKNKKNVDEARIFSAFMMSNILKILHPFIPFFTETLWGKNKFNNLYKTPLIHADWPKLKKQSGFDKSQNDISLIMEIISNIRTTKAELNITPKLYCDIIFSNESKKIKKIIQQNKEIVKQVGRIKKISEDQKNIKNTINILIMNEKISLKFDEEIDIISQKNKISEKIKTLNAKIGNLKNKLLNKAYLTKAPKNIVQNDKVLLRDLSIEENKLRSIVSSIN